MERDTQESLSVDKPDFPCPAGHSNAGAHRWIKEILIQILPAACQDNATFPNIDTLLAKVGGLQPSTRIAILRASVERLPWHRANSDSWKDENYKRGAVLYELVCHLYKRNLPYTENDICEILRFSRHGCGHGNDVTPPVDILLAYVRKHGVTVNLIDALRAFLTGLKTVSSAQAWHLKRKAAVILLLDLNDPPGKGAKACWSDGLRQSLLSLPAAESRRWQDLILRVSVHDQVRMPRAWARTAHQFLAELGTDRVVARLREWFPEPRQGVLFPVQTGGSHLLKHFVWVLESIPGEHETKPECDELVRRLAFMDWKPRERAVKFQIAAASYLAARPPAVARVALLHLAANTTGNMKGESRIKKIAQDFIAKRRPQEQAVG